jgi:hypothetical protein
MSLNALKHLPATRMLDRQVEGVNVRAWRG